jgi:hypothetical protein
MDFKSPEGKPVDYKPEISNKGDLPFVESDEAFLKKKPVNLFLSLVLMALAVFLVVLVLKNHYKKLGEKERFNWETGRQRKLQDPARNDMFQPLRNNWKQYISTSIEPAAKGSGKSSDVYVSVANKSPQALAIVVVTVYTLNWNYEASVQQSVMFRNVKSQQISRIKLSEITNRKGLHCKIKEITAPAFNFCYRNDMVTEGQIDPYYCTTGE